MGVNKLTVGLGGGSLLQIAERYGGPSMSYMLKSSNGKIIMIDGGWMPADADYLYNLIKSEGGRVDLWFITHAHIDHYGALLNMLKEKPDFDIEIERLIFDFPPLEWLGTVEKGESVSPTTEFLEQLELHGIRPEKLRFGDTFECSDIKIEVLNNPTDCEGYVSVNDTSAVLLVHFPKRNVLFLGDLAVEGQKKLLKLQNENKLKCDIVQMAHHGQQGVDRNFYEIVQPKICLYPTARWIWNNDIGKGIGSGPLKTLETRQWMEELGVLVSCVSADGDYFLI